MLYGTPNAIPGDSTTVTGASGDFFGSSTYMMWFGAIQNDKEHINVYTSSNRYLGSKVGKGLQLGFSYLQNACEDRGTSAGRTGSCQPFSGPAHGRTVNHLQILTAAAANYNNP